MEFRWQRVQAIAGIGRPDAYFAGLRAAGRGVDAHALPDHAAIDEAAGIIINPAGLTFTSVPILDALKMCTSPIIELHISNIHRREAIYHNSLVSTVATAVIAGLGAAGYPLAVRALLALREAEQVRIPPNASE